ILKKKFGDTTYQITLIPFGGFCQFYGENPTDERKGESFEFLSAHPLKRIVTVVMGPLFNLIFGIILFFTMNLIGYQTETNRINIPDIFQSGEYISPAFSAGLRTGDKIININDKEVKSFSEIQSGTMFSKGLPLQINVERDGNILNYTVTPKKFAEQGHYTIGVMPYGEKVLVVKTLENDIAAQSGIEDMDEVISADGKTFNDPKEFTDYIRQRPGQKINFRLTRAGGEIEVPVTPRFREIIQITKFEDSRFKGEQFDFETEKLDLIKKSIENKKVRINGKYVLSFDDFKSTLADLKNQRITLETEGGVYSGNIAYEEYGFIGVETAIAPEMVDLKYGIVDGFVRSFTEPYEFIAMNLKGMGMLFSGELNVRENLSGPIKIAKIAGDVAYHRGIAAFIILMAKISIILMVMNLLPIPVVDGSFIIFFLLEAVRGKPLSEKIMEKIQTVGITLLILLGVFVIFNDLSGFQFFQKFFD
ncbi:MAG: site-2 protease family protein, partial [Spirochaetes bacterium]|nr:site-2 protease family protein [Spirochaetota bacterium]